MADQNAYSKWHHRDFDLKGRLIEATRNASRVEDARKRQDTKEQELRQQLLRGRNVKVPDLSVHVSKLEEQLDDLPSLVQRLQNACMLRSDARSALSRFFDILYQKKLAF